MPPHTEINEEKKIVNKPVHHYRIPPEALPEEFRTQMDEVDYEWYAEHPEFFDENPKLGLKLFMVNNAEDFRYLHYFVGMKHLGLDPRAQDLFKLLRDAHSFQEAADAYLAAPNEYYRGEHPEQVEAHLAEIYDAVCRDMECMPTAMANMEKMLLNCRMPEVPEVLLESLKNNPDLQVLKRNEEEQKVYADHQKIVIREMAEDVAQQMDPLAGGSLRWANGLVHKPGLSLEEKKKIRALNDDTNRNSLQLFLRYLQELEAIDESELAPYNWDEYHGERRQLHVYNGILTFDMGAFLRDLKKQIPLTNEENQILQNYIDALSDNYNLERNESLLLVNPFAKELVFEKEGISEPEQQANNPIRTVRNIPQEYGRLWQSAVNSGIAMDGFRTSHHPHDELRKKEKREEFVKVLKSIGDRVKEKIRQLEQKDKEEEAPAEKAPVAARKDGEMLEPEINAGMRTSAYIRHAENLLAADPAVREKFAVFQEAMKNLTDYITELSRESGKQRLIVDEKMLRKLQNRYVEAERTGNALLLQAAAAGKKVPAGFKDTIRNVMDFLKSDRRMLSSYDPARKLTFPQIVNAAHSEFIDADAMVDSVRSGHMSNRLAMSVKVTEADGQTRYVKGLFTPAEYFESRQFIKDVVQKFKLTPQDAQRTRAEAMIARIVGSLKQIEKMRDIRLAMYMSDLEPLKDDRGVFTGYQWNGPVPVELQTWLDDKVNALNSNDLRIFEQFRIAMKDAIDKGTTMDLVGIPKQSRIDQRSSAMSAVAGLLGRSSLICTSRPAMIRKNGKLQKGTFIEFSEFTDSLEDPAEFSGLTEKALNHAGFVKDAADLQVLDFICGNVDRHHMNLFYRIENGKYTGLQGIDNDLSFGVLKNDYLTGKEKVTNFKSLSDMRIITRQMADVIKGLTKEMLQSVLSPYELSEGEIEAAGDRLELLKKAINDPYANMSQDEFQKKVDAALNNPHAPMFNKGNVYVMNDDQLNILAEHADRLLQVPNGGRDVNCFTTAYHAIAESKKTMSELKEKKIAYRKNEKKVPETSLHTAEPEIFHPEKFAELLQEHIKDLKAHNHGAFISSQEYRNLLAYAEIVQQKMGQLKDQTPAQIQSRSATMLENLQYLNQMYLDKKDTDGSLQKGTRASGRYDMVRKMQDTIESYCRRMSLTLRQDYGRLSAIQRAGGLNSYESSEKIAEYIKYMKGSDGQFQMENANLFTFFETVSQRTYAKTFTEYGDILGSIASRIKTDASLAEVNSRIEETQKYLETLTHNDHGMRNAKKNLDELRNLITGCDGKEGILEKARAWKMTPEHADRIMDLHELVHLCDQANENSASPQSACRQRIAERLTRVQLQEHPESLRSSRKYEDTFRSILNGDVMIALTAGKNLEQLKKYASESDADLRKHWQKASAKLNSLRQAAPQASAAAAAR